MGAHEVLVGQVQARRCHGASDHQFGALEEVLIMGAKRRTIRKDQGRLATATSPAAALGIVGRRWWNVAQVNDVELCDIHPEFHRRRAIEDRQLPRAEALLALDTLGVRHLCRVLAGFKPCPCRSHGAIEVDKKGIRAAACL